MDVKCLYESDPSSDFVDEEIWEGTDDNSAGDYWVETGMTEGTPWGSGRVFFWADLRPNGGGYNEHEVSGLSAQINTNYLLNIGYGGEDEWLVSIDDALVGTSTANPPYSQYVSGGSEFTNDSVRAAASFSSLEWTGVGGTVYTSWGGEGVVYGLGSVSVPAAPYTSFSNYYDGTGSCTADEAAQSSSGSTSAEVVNPVPPATISGATQSALLGKTDSVASWLGEAAPENITAVPTTRYAANQLVSGAAVNSASGQPDTTGVYLVQATGNFTLSGAGPSGSQVSGSVLTLVIDPTTNQLLDWGIRQTPLTEAQLATLGTTTTLQEAGQ